jgi:hypothetical protein
MKNMGLFEPAWQGKNIKKAVKAVNKLADQKQLAQIAREAMNFYARVQAIDKLTDQNIIIDIAKNDHHRDIRRAAIINIADQNVLVDIAKNDGDEITRMAAASCLSDQTALEDIVENDENFQVCHSAIKMLTNQAALTKIANDKTDKYLREWVDFRPEFKNWTVDQNNERERKTQIADLRWVARKRLEDLLKELGASGMAIFIRQFENGKGDYTAEREETLKDISIDDIVSSIKKRKSQL